MVNETTSTDNIQICKIGGKVYISLFVYAMNLLDLKYIKLQILSLGVTR